MDLHASSRQPRSLRRTNPSTLMIIIMIFVMIIIIDCDHLHYHLMVIMVIMLLVKMRNDDSKDDLLFFVTFFCPDVSIISFNIACRRTNLSIENCFLSFPRLSWKDSTGNLFTLLLQTVALKYRTNTPSHELLWVISSDTQAAVIDLNLEK